MKKRDAVCAHCGKEYTERKDASYRHFDRTTGGVTWCHSRSMARRIAIQTQADAEAARLAAADKEAQSE